MMTKKLFKYFIYPYQNTWSQIASLERVLSATNLEEFEKNTSKWRVLKIMKLTVNLLT